MQWWLFRSSPAHFHPTYLHAGKTSFSQPWQDGECGVPNHILLECIVPVFFKIGEKHQYEQTVLEGCASLWTQKPSDLRCKQQHGVFASPNGRMYRQEDTRAALLSHRIYKKTVVSWFSPPALACMHLRWIYCTLRKHDILRSSMTSHYSTGVQHVIFKKLFMNWKWCSLDRPAESHLRSRRVKSPLGAPFLLHSKHILLG